ncbi:FKBP-type peptidyl-prolyl cis-trans isomerase [Roseiconus sp. JC912]|uniref:FKBP-type peptidyl-prolyl cis-trans isomerase n=2 Tax=Pirellulaceae TaxID=2691357 RepID=UPI003A4C547A
MQRCLMVLVAVSMMTIMTNAQDSESADAPKVGKSEKEQMGYFLGLSMGQQLVRQGLRDGDFDTASFATGLGDSLASRDMQLSREELFAVQDALQKMLNGRHEEMLAEIKKMAADNKAKGEAWLKENATKEGVKELAGGLQYKVIKEGEGDSPSASDTVRVHYTGKLINGETFDSSVERGEPTEFRVGGVIKGWQMALQKMKAGSKWMLYIPSDLAYGEQGSQGAIGPNEVLVFEVELLEIK